MNRFIASLIAQLRTIERSISLSPKVLFTGGTGGETSERAPLKLPPNYAPNMMYPKDQPTPEDLLLDQLPNAPPVPSADQTLDIATQARPSPVEVPSLVTHVRRTELKNILKFLLTIFLLQKFKRTVKLAIAGPRDFDVIVDMLQSYYVQSEPLLKSLGITVSDDHLLMNMWRKQLQEGSHWNFLLVQDLF